jgi:hypothetical protein
MSYPSVGQGLGFPFVDWLIVSSGEKRGISTRTSIQGPPEGYRLIWTDRPTSAVSARGKISYAVEAGWPISADARIHLERVSGIGVNQVTPPM